MWWWAVSLGPSSKRCCWARGRKEMGLIGILIVVLIVVLIVKLL